MNTPHLTRALRALCLTFFALLAAACEMPNNTPSFTITYPPLPGGLDRAVIERVVDGDTFIARVNGRRERVRLLGIDTPESVDERQLVECFGKEASARAQELLTPDSTVLLEADRSQNNRDQFDRLLRYAWFEDGRLFNMQMIAEGYAYEYTYNVPYKYRDQFKEVQQQASSNNRGLWSPQACSGLRSTRVP
jgi:micrococcal nuclease